MGKIVRNTKGQVSIFFATTIVVLITFIAFIVNIGLFVKAKINLQNATDAAAFAGASVQARQLTNIAYLNWEMRNVYKEWMFKYYVLGNLSHDTIFTTSPAKADFRMKSIDENRKAEFGVDVYNFPSVCVNFQASDANAPNICRIYSIPGLPAFENNGISGVDQVTTALLNTLSSSKMEACTRRAALNFLTANLWAYNIKGQGGLSALAPEIAPERQGAFPAAFELALRVRNLEKLVNTPPWHNGLCKDKANAASACGIDITALESQNTPGNERAVKAFYSGYRNLGNDGDIELKNSFTLTELPPKEFNAEPEKSLSNLLIPQGETKKYFLDLKLMTINYATFFTSFTGGDAREIGTSAGTVAQQGQCDATKIALPVPGYPLGFVKSNRVLTYYAVRGTALWTGLFNPFQVGADGKGIKITAYAAAKPMGGRIGPMLFDVFSEPTEVRGRKSSIKNVSSGYVMGLNLSTIYTFSGEADTTGSSFVSGAPLPTSSGAASNGFWLSNDQGAVGGWVQDGALVFSLPNLVYDYPNGTPMEKDSYYSSPEAFDISIPAPGATQEMAGLYNGAILNKFKANLTGLGNGGPIGPNAVSEGIQKVRGPTLYEANNYLIPSPASLNEELGVDSFGATNGVDPVSGSYNFRIYAPLFSSSGNALFKNPGDAVSVLSSFLDIQQGAVEKFRNAMNAAAIQISRITTKEGANVGKDAALGFSDFDYSMDAGSGKPTCASITGKFVHFFLGGIGDLVSANANCGDIKPLAQALREYWTAGGDELGDVYQSTYTISEEMKNHIWTAYRPGPLHDADPNGLWSRTIGSATMEKMWRNYYSTKFVSLNSLVRSGGYEGEFPIMSEGNTAQNQIIELSVNQGGNGAEQGFANALDIGSTGIDINRILH